MKKAYILLSVLAVLCALTLVSCRGLASSKPQTTDFTYTIDDNLIRAIIRSGTTPDNTPCTINITIKSKTGDAYSNSQTATGPLSTLKAKSFEFTDVPLNTPLVLTVTVYVNNKIVYSSKAKEFTLTSDAVTEIEAILNLELDTPMLTWAGEGNSRNYNILNGESTMGLGISNPSDYCFDRDDNFWFIEGGQLGYIPAGSGAATKLNNTYSLSSIDFDPVTNKLCLIKDEYKTYSVYSVDPQSVLNNSEWSINNNDMVSITTFDQTSDILTYTYNDVFYTIEKWDDSEYPYTYLRTFSVETGEENSSGINLYDSYVWEASALEAFSGFLKIMSEEEQEVFYDEHEDELWNLAGNKSDYLTSYSAYYSPYGIGNYNDELDLVLYSWGGAYLNATTTFTDMVVYGGDIYIPFNQHYCQEQYDNLMIPAIYIDRGGILVIDAETLKIKNVIGLESVKSKVSAPLYIYNNEFNTGSRTDTYNAPAYHDSDLKNPFEWEDISVTWAVGAKDGRTLRYPEKIIAIKPKKLILADTGNYYYKDSDNLFSMAEGSRIVSVDLETFAVTVENDNSTIPAMALSNGTPAHSKITSYNGTVYGPYRTVNGSGYINGYDYSSSQDFEVSECSYLIAKVEFGECGE